MITETDNIFYFAQYLRVTFLGAAKLCGPELKLGLLSPEALMMAGSLSSKMIQPCYDNWNQRAWGFSL